MCIIAIKPKDKEIQKKETLQTCFNRNHDGAGYMFVNDKSEVVIKKGYMKFDEYYKDLMNDYNKYNLKNKNLIMHFRIGTSGQSKTGCTHPFVISTDYTELEKTRNKTNIGVCHNGIVSMFNSRLAQYSDTEIYITTVLAPIIKLQVNAYTFDDIRAMIKATTSSKWAFLDKFDKVYTVGDFEEDNGYLYSNSTYKSYSAPKQYRSWFDDDWYDYYGRSNTHRTPVTKTNLLSKPATTPTHPTSLNKLEVGNVVIGEKVEYLEIDVPNTYYFDANYRLYKRVHSNKGDVEGYSVVDKDIMIYNDETFVKRLEFEKGK